MKNDQLLCCAFAFCTRSQLILSIISIVACCCLFFGTVRAQLPTSFQKVELVTGLKNSVNFEFAPDGRIFIVDRYGEIFIYKPTNQITVSAGVINVFHDMEDGLLALAFDPNFTTNNFVYIHYSHPTLPKNQVSRFTMNGDQLDLASEVVIIDWTSDRNGYYHAAGDLDFDSNGNLYIAIGDNTNHTPYAPLNEGDKNQSAERTSSNTNDLRGKILRIKPNLNGTYSIPTGNLFPGGVGGRPEIYVMGARNPFKIMVDRANTNWLFWGEVGPDANVESLSGPEGLDEINLVKAAGNYGWPYFSGKNEVYLNTYKQPNFYYDHANPVNVSKWNTGATNLPAAQPSWLEFFHGCYLAGPRYYFSSSINNPKKLPTDFHGGFFYFDFNTSKIWLVKMDANGNILSNQRFAENIITGAGFIDLKIGPDGQLYILEYGAGCCPGNIGSGKLVRVDYTGIDTNKAPQVSLSTNKISGPLPLTINFSSEGTVDADGDPLTYEWDFQSDGTIDSTDPNPSFTYTVRGTFTALLRVSDSDETVSRGITVYPGNTAATIQVNYPPDGGMFSWGDDVTYDFDVTDAEDGSTANNSISCNEIDFVPAFGHLTHSHDGLTINQCSGTFSLDPTSHDDQGEDNIYYVFKVSYKDDDGLTVHDQITIYPRLVEAEFYADQNNTKLVPNTDALGGGVSSVRALLHNAYIKLAGRNMTNIDSVSYRLASSNPSIIEVRADSLTGPILSTVNVPVTGNLDRWTHVRAPITNPGGKHDLFLIFKSPGMINFVDLNYIEFRGAGVSQDVTPPTVYATKVITPKEIRVKFNEPLQKASAINVSNYVINNGIQISSAELMEDRKTVRLSTSPLSIGVTNQISISNVRNAAGLPMTSAVVEQFTLQQSLTRINAGGPQLEFAGIEWQASQFNIGGAIGSKPGLQINNTTFDELYQTELNGNFSMNIPVPSSGLYDVNLHFAETTYKGAGDRIFSVSVENDQYTLVNYDIVAKTGYATLLIEEVKGIRVTDGFLNITFTGVKNKAKLSALEVLFGDAHNAEPDITITNPGKNLSLSQPFKINFKVEDWWIASGSSHVRLFIDNVFSKNIYNTEPLTIQGLSPGLHTFKLVLVDKNNVLSTFSDEVQVTVVSPTACVDNPFPSAWEEYIIGADLPYRAPQFYAADLDNDGDKDIVGGGWWYANPGFVKGVWTRNVIGAPLHNMFLVHDLDRDGDLDLLGTQGAYLGTKLAWAQNDGHGNFTIYTNLPNAGFPEGNTNNNTFLAGAAVGNFNGVSNIQIALVWNGSETTKAPVKMLTVPADPVNTVWSVADIAPNAVGETITAIDLDKDGDLDLCQAKNWLRNNGNGTWTTISTGVVLPTYYEHHVISDFDRDGDLDGVFTQIGENQEVVWVQVPPNPTQTWTKSTLGTDVDSGLSLDYADLDFDGDMDVITAEWKVEKRLIAFENDLCNSGTWVKHILHPGSGSTGPDHHNSAQTADLDNDGDLDIISVGWDKRTPRIYINNSSTISGNTAPVVANPLTDQPASVNVQFTLIFPETTFSDPDGDLLSYTATLASGAALPSWLTFKGTTRTFSGKPPVGSGINLTIKLTAKDNYGGSVSDEFMIVFTNLPPVVQNPIPNQTFMTGQALTYSFPQNTFVDGNGDPLTYTAHLQNSSTLPSWLAFNATTRTFSGTPAHADAGTYQIQVNATDGTSVVNDIFQILLFDGSINQPPVVLNPVSNVNASVGLPFTFTFAQNAFSDPNGDPLTYVAVRPDSTALPAWLSFNSATRTFSGTPTASDLGVLQVRLYARDGSASTSLVFEIHVEAGGSIRLNSGGQALSAYGTTFDVDNFFTGGGVYTNNKIADIAGTVFDELYKSERNKPFAYEVPLPPGKYTIKLHFAEIYFGATGGGTGGIGSRVFNVTAEGAPLLTNFDIFAEGGAMRAVIKQFDVNVTDGKLNLNFVKVVQNPKVSAVEIIPVTTSGGNAPPLVATPIPDQSTTTGSAFNYQVPSNTFVDPDSDPLTYSAQLSNGSSLPSWLSFSSLTRTFSGTPSLPATLAIRVTVSDGKGGSVDDIFSLVVQSTTVDPSVRINAGGPQFTNSSGFLFAADRSFLNGSVYTNNNIADIAGTTNDVLYKTERYKMTGYEIPVANGTYTLVLHFAEIYFGATGGGVAGVGKRVFSVTAEGVTLLSNFDIYAEAGSMTALIKQFDVSVSDGGLSLGFIKGIDNPKISAIEIIPTSGGSSSARMKEPYVETTSEEVESNGFYVFPNPVESSATFEYQSDEDESISLEMISAQGMLIQTVFVGSVAKGASYRYEFDASHLANGIYFLRMQSKRRVLFRKVIVTRTN